jgi:hypothetical protein
LPVPTWVQLKERITSNLVTPGMLGDTILDVLHDCLGFCLGLLTFTRKLDLAERDKPMMKAPCPMEIIEGVFKLGRVELLLGVSNPSQTD